MVYTMSEQTYSTAQIASLLNLTRAMINKYALAIEEFSGKKIPQTAKDGRQFSLEDYQTLAQAKAYVDSEKLTLNSAVRKALGQVSLNLTASGTSLVGIDTSQALATVVHDNRAALEALIAANQANNDLLLSEMRRLTDNLSTRELPDVSTQRDKAVRDGPIVRFARRIEKFLGRK